MSPSLKLDTAVSDTLGFVLISGILLTSVSMVFLIGLPVYNSYVDQSHMQNMAEGFDLISENGNNVALLKTPYQQSELKLYDGTIAQRGVGMMYVEFYDGNSLIGLSESVPLDVIEYTKGDAHIAYLLGGVFWKQGITNTVIKKPEIYDYQGQDGTTVLFMPFVCLKQSQSSMMGTTLARISFGTWYYSKKNQVVGQPMLHTYPHVTQIKIKVVDCDYSPSLKYYFEHENIANGVVTINTATPDSLELQIDYPGSPITVNTIQSWVTVTINSGSS